MMLLEHDAKTLLSGQGIAIPHGFLASTVPDQMPFDFPCIVKAQVPIGGRGKAGGVVRADSREECGRVLDRLIGSKLLGHSVQHCRIESPVSGRECYLAIMLDSSTAEVTILASESGGVEVENNSDTPMHRTTVSYDERQVRIGLEGLSTHFSGPIASAVLDAGLLLSKAFFERELMLAEINPLFVGEDGKWVAGDAKIVIDDNAIERQPLLHALLRDRIADYESANIKLQHGFDFVRLHSDGDVGLVTTGAGLSMQLIDELERQGCRPYNFCDIRTGQFRGQPDRLIAALKWMTEAPALKVVLMNFFAGVTDLGELAQLILVALEQTPELRVPVIIRIVGNGLENAKSILSAGAGSLVVETDLDAALVRVVELAHTEAGI